MVSRIAAQCFPRFDDALKRCEFLQVLLCALIVIPEVRCSGFRFKAVYFESLPSDVKDTPWTAGCGRERERGR
jgi:hypothetical protein